MCRFRLISSLFLSLLLCFLTTTTSETMIKPVKKLPDPTYWGTASCTRYPDFYLQDYNPASGGSYLMMYGLDDIQPKADVTIVGLYYADSEVCQQLAKKQEELGKKVIAEGFVVHNVILNNYSPQSCAMEKCEKKNDAMTWWSPWDSTKKQKEACIGYIGGCSSEDTRLDVENWQSKLSSQVSVPIFQDTLWNNVWDQFGGGQGDLFIYDRSGRLYEYLCGLETCGKVSIGDLRTDTGFDYSFHAAVQAAGVNSTDRCGVMHDDFWEWDDYVYYYYYGDDAEGDDDDDDDDDYGEISGVLNQINQQPDVQQAEKIISGEKTKFDDDDDDDDDDDSKQWDDDDDDDGDDDDWDDDDWDDDDWDDDSKKWDDDDDDGDDDDDSKKWDDDDDDDVDNVGSGSGSKATTLAPVPTPLVIKKQKPSRSPTLAPVSVPPVPTGVSPVSFPTPLVIKKKKPTLSPTLAPTLLSSTNGNSMMGEKPPSTSMGFRFFSYSFFLAFLAGIILLMTAGYLAMVLTGNMQSSFFSNQDSTSSSSSMTGFGSDSLSPMTVSGGGNNKKTFSSAMEGAVGMFGIGKSTAKFTKLPTSEAENTKKSKDFELGGNGQTPYSAL